jgi:ferric-dicitrate binding protein FerR (iron transport regulator)
MEAVQLLPSAKDGIRNSTLGDDPQRESQRILERVARESDTVGASSLAKSVSDHFTAAETSDPVEKWGRRIGRGLALIALVYLLLWLLSFLTRP